MLKNWSFYAKLIFILSALTAPRPSFAESGFPLGLNNLAGVTFSQTALVVDKAKKKLYLFKDEGGLPHLAETYDADLGKSNGDKHSAGDNKTPEGIYFFQKLMDGKEINYEKYGEMVFTTDYPNFFDRMLGKGGSGIWLHAVSDKISLERGSQGCVVVRNDTIKKLESQISLKLTPLMIFDRVQWVSESEFKTSREKLTGVIKKWKDTWQGKQLNEYFSMYWENFRFKKMNLKQFKTYKTNLAKRRANIEVKLSEPQVFEHNGDVYVRFFQDYKSPEHSDFGIKTVYMRRFFDDYKIIGEFWEPVDEEIRKSLSML